MRIAGRFGLLSVMLGLVLALSLACSSRAAPQGEAIPARTEAGLQELAEKSSWTDSFISQVFRGQDMPDGVNPAHCTPAPGKNHVVLVHGTFSSTLYSYGALAPRLAKAGYCVHARDFGAKNPNDWFKATQGVDASAREIAAFVDEVQARTGAESVDLIGHSQGGLIGFYYLKKLNGASKVRNFVALAPSVRGTTLAKTPKREQVQYCEACADQHPKSELIADLHASTVIMQGVQYKIVVTENDKVVLPIESQFIREPGVRNVLIQDYLPGKRVSHSGMLYDDDCLKLIIATLEGEPFKPEMKQPESAVPQLTIR